MQFQSGQPAQIAHAQLTTAVKTMNDAEHCAVLWYAEIERRRLYRPLGYSSMQQYATVALKFSKARACDFSRLAKRLDELPAVRESVAAGKIGYTKAREIVKVASAQTEKKWLDAAATMNRRDLEQKVARVKKKARARKNAAQVEMLPASAEAPLAKAVPVRVGVTMTAEQAARWEALWQRLDGVPNAEDLLEALATLADERGTQESTSDCENDSSTTEFPRGNRPPIQIHVHQCPDCGAAESAGHQLDQADTARLTCDAAIDHPGKRNTTTIPPRTRRQVLARDRHRCTAPGCTHTRFLEVHHKIPRARGGTNDPANLTTLCAACHRLWHEHQLTSQRTREVNVTLG